MKKLFTSILVVYIFLCVCGSVFAQTRVAVGERYITFGGASAWNNTDIKAGITEARDIRNNSVLILSSVNSYANSYSAGYTAVSGVPGSFSALTESALDMSVSFDERENASFRDSAGRYRVMSPEGLERVDRSLARGGSGAVLFGGSGPVRIIPQSRNALFAPGNRIGDFTIEFWLYPLNMENGERFFTWSSSVSHNGNISAQSIHAVASRNRLQWSFINFFTSTDESSRVNVEFSGNAPVVPKTWSHHLVRFDSKTGLIEYLVNGRSEAISYATARGRESAEVFTPIAGTGGAFLLGESFIGLLDELKIHSVCAGRSIMQRYPSSGGRMETGAIDLGTIASNVTRIDVTGGRAGSIGNTVINEYRQNGRFYFSDDAQLTFFIRSGENPFSLHNKAWVGFTPGEQVSGIHGRYVQIAADFYPSSDGEVSPFIEQINIVFIPGQPPSPPRNLTAVAVDGGVQLRWRHSSTTDTEKAGAGYLVYYSAVRDDLFGEGASLGSSPIDAGMTNGLVINGLQNGTLYYFKVAGYESVNGSDRYNVGEFSAEVRARPLSGL